MTHKELWGKIRIKMQNLPGPEHTPGQVSFVCNSVARAAERFFCINLSG